MVTAPMITPSVLPPLLGIMTTVNAYHTMLIIDKIRAAVQAHRRPFSSPEATINETIARGTNAAPSAMPNPGVEACSADRFRRGRSKADSIIGCNKASWAINPIPKKSPAIPTIMLTVAAIVTPRGRDLVALCISFLSPPLCPPCWGVDCKSMGTRLFCQRCS